MRNRQESYTPQQIADRLKQKQVAIKCLIDGLADSIQCIALIDDDRYTEEKNEAILRVAEARELLQELHIMTERSVKYEK